MPWPTVVVHTDEWSLCRDANVSNEGKFLAFVQLGGDFTAELINQIVVVTRIIASHEKYLRELSSQLYIAYDHRAPHIRMGSLLTQWALDRLNLPNVER